jgi:hypothetical protein
MIMIVRAACKWIRLHSGWNKRKFGLRWHTGNIFEDKLQAWARSGQMVVWVGWVKF